MSADKLKLQQLHVDVECCAVGVVVVVDKSCLCAEKSLLGKQAVSIKTHLQLWWLWLRSVVVELVLNLFGHA